MLIHPLKRKLFLLEPRSPIPQAATSKDRRMGGRCEDFLEVGQNVVAVSLEIYLVIINMCLCLSTG